MADRGTRGAWLAWLRGWRLVTIDRFDVDLFDAIAGAEEFGYAGSERTAQPT